MYDEINHQETSDLKSTRNPSRGLYVRAATSSVYPSPLTPEVQVMYNHITHSKGMKDMATLTKRPIQVYLEERQDSALRRIAESKDVSLSELIRRSIDLYLNNLSIEDDPAMKIVGLGRSGLGDLSEKHDEYLIEWEKEANQP